MGKMIPFSVLIMLFISLIARSESSLSKHQIGISPQDEEYYKVLLSSSSATIKCKDGSKKFSESQLNDDFCDCPDGTDEPGTSACLHGKFYCRNAGHVPLSIYSSRVNDGICDCCDGSDEYDGKTKCSNTCWEAGKAARDKLKKKIATFKEGVIIRKKEVEQAKVAIEKDEAELLKLKNEEKILKGLVQQLKEHKELIEKAEEKERLQNEKEEKEKKEADDAEKEKSENVEEAENKGKPVEDKIGLMENFPMDKDAVEHPNDSADENIESKRLPETEVQEDVLTKERESPVPHEPDIDNLSKDVLTKERESPVPHESDIDNLNKDVLTKERESPVPHESDIDNLNKEKDVSEETSSLSKEELGRLVASRWTGEDAGKQATEASDAVKSEDNESFEVSSKDVHSESNEEYDSETEDDSHRYDDDEDEEADDHVDDLGEENHDDSSSSYPSVTEDDEDLSDSDISTASDLSWLEKIQQSVRNILQAVNLFQPSVNISEAARVRKEYDDSSAKLSKIQSRISSLTKKLEQDFGPEKEFFSFYKKCFEMKQNKYVYKVCPFKQATQEEGYSTTRLGNWDKFEDSYRVMVFSSGDKCWNGPDRSLKIKLRCGLENEVTDVDEPSRCEYAALLATPALCVEEKLKELEGKVELLNQQQPQGHDEL